MPENEGTSPSVPDALSPEVSLQEAQAKRHEQWVAQEGGMEGPTHEETMAQPCQQKRLEWLKARCKGTTSILECGCNWGFVLDAVDGEVGLDINRENIKLARQHFPKRCFECWDISICLPYDDKSFDIVLLPDCLEHIPWAKVPIVLKEAMRTCRKKVLITLPIDEEKATNFKHPWRPTQQKINEIMAYFQGTVVGNDGDFVYMEGLKCRQC